MRRIRLLTLLHGRLDSRRDETGGGDRGRSQTGDRHAEAKREDVMRPGDEGEGPRLDLVAVRATADTAKWHAEADRIAGGPERWYSRAGWKQDYEFLLIGFATQDQADEMQEWISASRIDTRPAPPKYDGPMLTVASGVEPS